MARFEMAEVRALGDLESSTEMELEAPPRRFGTWAKAAGVACSVALLGGAAMLFKGEAVKGNVQGAVEFALVGHSTGEAEEQCLAIDSATSAYKHALAMGGPPVFSEMGVAAEKELIKYGHKKVKTYKKFVTDDHDFVSWWVKDGACVIAFQGSDSQPDFTNNWNPSPMDKWNLTQVHTGLTLELEPLLTKMQPDFAQMKQTCTSSVTVTGHSLGGGVAQLFTMVMNNNADAMNAGFKVDKLYTFGAMPVAAVDVKNAQAEDACFPGVLYFNAENSTGSVRVDIVRATSCGAPQLQPIKYIKKVLLFSTRAPIEYPCGTDIDASVGPYPGFDLHDPRIYASQMGCGYIDDLNIEALAVE